MYAKHYHHYDPSGTTHIMDRFRKMGWVPPSEDKTYQKKWKYFQECAWRKENAKQHA
jgi:transposase